LLAQQAGAHALWLGAFTKTHVAETERPDATTIAATSTSEAVTLVTITCFLACSKTARRGIRSILGM
jgi:hypothetical protein